ncbi:hypothetical protein O181_099837 [Austropuccinia psidii MF-1]|uniref:Tet-like 2OG-Fe(II) oxygenase domain-containing protein n=1 Tax=Austropuccinia psidii MF-1 TaxID=1389203 RepID=A0A9Q3PGX7_9BASI|nr:hypothetical protein [Austropuccinia psidii MF-1]
MSVSANMTPSEIQRVMDVTQIKRIHFGRMAIFSSTGLLIALVKFRAFTRMSEVKVNQWDELSQFSFVKENLQTQLQQMGNYWRDLCLQLGGTNAAQRMTQFGIRGSLGRIEDAKDEWQNQVANPSSMGCILGQSLQYVGDELFQKIQNCYKSLGVLSFDQVNYEANISTKRGEFEFPSALTFTMNRFKNLPHVDKGSFLYSLG